MKFFYPRARVVISAIVENYKESQSAQIFDATPTSISIRRNSYKQADSWSIEFDARDFPILPALVRTGNVEIYVWDAKGLGEASFVVPQATQCQPIAGLEPTICGILDNVNMEFSADGRAVNMEGQDYTALFIEHQFKGRRTIVGQRLGAVLKGLISEVDRRGVLTFKTELPDSFGSTESEIFSKLPNIGKAAGITNSKRGFPVKRGDSFWDVMYKLAINSGFILFIRGLDVVLALPQSITEKSNTRRQFLFTWGENLESVRLERKMGKEKIPQIEVRAYDDRTRSTVAVTFPSRKQKVTTGVGTKRNEVVTHVVYGIRDKEQLTVLAETLYNLLAQTEQKVHVRTRDLVDSDEANLVNIRTGDAVYVKFQPFNNEVLDKLSAPQRFQWFIERGFSQSAARVLQQGYSDKQLFEKPFYVREAEVNWTSDGGFELSLDMVNFVTRDGVQESGEVTGAAE